MQIPSYDRSRLAQIRSIVHMALARNGTMAQQQRESNIWVQMSYAPPRGPCSHKSSILTSCPCYRFMLHPLKGSTSFECDGCGHHASFHKMDNKEDEESVRRWKEAERHRDGMHVATMHLVGFDRMEAATQQSQRRQIEDESTDGSLQVLEDVPAEVPRPARKRQRMGGR